MAISTAVGLERVSRVVGYQVKAGNFSEVSPNLPMRVAILGEANIGNQAGLSLDPQEILSAKEAGDIYGFGSPIYQIIRILRPLSGGGIGGIPTVVYPQEVAAGAVGAVRTITVTATAIDKNATHSVLINGRNSVDGQSYDYTVLTTDTVDQISQKISDAVNSVVGSPVVASVAANVVTLTSKWEGLTSEQLYVEPSVFGDPVGITYVVGSTSAGAGTPDISVALDQFGSDWNTIVINPYDAEKFADLETKNGTPDVSVPAGQYTAHIFRPFVSIWGSTDSTVAGITPLTDDDSRKDQVTHVLASAPNSLGFTFEASANLALLWALVGQQNPHLDVSGSSYSDMPVPADKKIGDFADYEKRDVLAKKGASTVDIVNGKYVIQDSLTTYHPDGEVIPAWRYVRSLIQDWNVRFGYYLLEKTFILDKAIASNEQVVNVSGVIKPKQVVQLLNSYADDLANRGLIVEPSFMQNSIQVGTGESNPDRIESSFRYKRSPFVRISSTTAEAGFAFGLRG